MSDYIDKQSIRDAAIEQILNNKIYLAAYSYQYMQEAPEAEVDVSKLSEDEQADLIIKRLSTAPKQMTLEEKIIDIMSKKLADDIDAEILKGLYK